MHWSCLPWVWTEEGMACAVEIYSPHGSGGAVLLPQGDRCLNWPLNLPCALPHAPHLQGSSPQCVRARFSRVLFFANHWTVALQAPLCMGSSTQEYRSGLPGTPAGDLPDPGVIPASLMSPALATVFFTTSAIWEGPLSQWLPATFLA